MAKYTKRSHIHPKLRVVLYSILFTFGGLLFGSILWVFHRIQTRFGEELAEVAAALMSILILALIMVGMRAGWSLDRFIRHRRIDVWRIHRSIRQTGYFLSLLGYEEVQPQVSLPESAVSKPAQLLANMERPKRRGRPPTHSLDRWTRVISAWENRDPYRNPMTLAEFLTEEFGTYADGTPCMSENSFYENRKKVFEALRKDAMLQQETGS
ncbi:MAG: hypothetical protein QY306_04235 [Anaerolineales bacterium]|nr:MAG: hypothetical protein QY306_04235 [Anaerolineales bacterium]